MAHLVSNQTNTTFSFTQLTKYYDPSNISHWNWLQQLALAQRKIDVKSKKELWLNNPFGVAIAEENFTSMQLSLYAGDFYAIGDMLIKQATVGMN